MAEPYSDPLVAARFWSKVQVGRPGMCWPWQSQSRNEHGYGIFKPRKGEPVVKAHRFAWQLANGRPCEGVVRHTCDNPPCCNPAHLALGTQRDNVADMHERGRRIYASVLTVHDLTQIKERLADGERQHDVASRFGVSASYISMLNSGARGVSIGRTQS